MLGWRLLAVALAAQLLSGCFNERPTPITNNSEPKIAAAEKPAEGGWANQPDRKPRKRALLVGISKYARPGKPGQPPGWWNLSCESDVKAIKEVLLQKFGFREADILVLADEEATRQGIITAFREHLISGAGPDDVAYFHFSGHGQQIPDDNGDELDGLDESLVPFDYISQVAADGEKTNLRDDTLGELLDTLRERMSVDG